MQHRLMSPMKGVDTGLVNVKSTDLSTGNYWDSPNTTDFEFSGTSAFSFAFWLKPDTLASAMGIFSRGTANNGGYELFYSASLNKLRWTISGDGGFIVRDSTAAPLSTSAWTHVALTYDGSEDSSGMKFYLNGSLDSSTSAANTGPGDITINGTVFKLGGQCTGRALTEYDGHIDEFYIYTKELSSGDVTTLYNGGAHSDVTSCTAAYRCGDAAGDSSTVLEDVQGTLDLGNVGSPTFVSDVHS